MSEVEDAIRRAAEQEGIDPATALAYAQRESSFNPRARSSKTIRGLFQMKGDLREKYGVGDSDDVGTQVKGFGRLLADNKATMSRRLGRDVTDAEAYAGHHFGAGRAARMFNMAPDTPVDQVFTRSERAQNPHFDKAGNVGSLLSSVTGDIDKRRASFGGGGMEDFSNTGAEVEGPDFSAFGSPVENANAMPLQSNQHAAGAPLDFSQFGSSV